MERCSPSLRPGKHVIIALQTGRQGQAEQGPCTHWDNQAGGAASSPMHSPTSQKVEALSSRQVTSDHRSSQISSNSRPLKQASPAMVPSSKRARNSQVGVWLRERQGLALDCRGRMRSPRSRVATGRYRANRCPSSWATRIAEQAVIQPRPSPSPSWSMASLCKALDRVSTVECPLERPASSISSAALLGSVEQVCKRHPEMCLGVLCQRNGAARPRPQSSKPPCHSSRSRFFEPANQRLPSQPESEKSSRIEI